MDMKRRFSLRAARIQVGLGRAEAAEKIGVNGGTIWRWERGIQSPPADMAERICRMYGFKFEDIDWTKGEK